MVKKIHFIGINGSGTSGVAIIAHKMGFEVSGCDIQSDTPYAPQVLSANMIRDMFV